MKHYFQSVAVVLVCLMLFALAVNFSQPTVCAMPHGILFRVVEAHDDDVVMIPIQEARYACKSSLVNYAKKGQVIHCQTYSADQARETGHSFFCEGGTWNLDLKKITFQGTE